VEAVIDVTEEIVFDRCVEDLAVAEVAQETHQRPWRETLFCVFRAAHAL
jgi:hypothetical protein